MNPAIATPARAPRVVGPDTRRRLFLPSVSRHLTTEFARSAGLTFTAFIAIYVVADFFDRFDTYLKHDVPVATIARAFLYKLPLIVTQVTPMAVLAGGLVGLGLLARQQEFVALRSCGVSVFQMALPLVAAGALISVGMLAWSEQVVPRAARKWHDVDNLEIRKRGSGSVFTGREIWYHGRAGFYDIGRVQPRRHLLQAITIYQLGDDFRPVRIITAPSARWTGVGWELESPRTREFGPNGPEDRDGLPDGFALPETLEDFQVGYVEPEEYSYRQLRQQIDLLRVKGVDASESWVDLHLKLALPAASLVMVLLAVPLAARGTRATSLPAAVALGFGVGFGYYILLGFARALGQSHTLPPLLAAWTPNLVFAGVGAYFLLGAD